MMKAEDLASLGVVTFALIVLIGVVRLPNLDHRWKLLLATLLTFEGFSLTFLASKVPWYAGMIMIIVAGFHLFRLLQEKPDTLLVKSIGTRFMNWATNGGLYTRWFPLVGLFISITVVVANAWFFNQRFGSNDFTVLVAAATWLGYGYVPSIYYRERDFLFIFINLLVLLLVVPLTSYNLVTGNTTGEYMTPGEQQSVEIFLTLPLTNLLNLVGFDTYAAGETLHYRLDNGEIAIVSIAQGCSGLYSVAVFVSAFMAFVATEYNRFDSLVTSLLLFGILAAYFANLFRMALIVIVGHYYGREALEWTHSNAGWLIFLIWVGFFWSIIATLFKNQQIALLHR